MPKGVKGFQKGHKVNKNRVFSLERRKNISEGIIKIKNNKVCKEVMHDWVRRWKGRPTECEVCGVVDKNKTYDWANVDHKYKRILDDYIRMCRSCHRKYDIKNNGYRIGLLK